MRFFHIFIFATSIVACGTSELTAEHAYLGVDTSAPLRVYRTGTGFGGPFSSVEDIRSAESSNPDIVRVERVDEVYFVARAVAPGSAEITVRTGLTESVVMPVTVSPLGSVDFYTCSGVVLSGHPFYLEYSAEGESGNRVVGFDESWLQSPVEMDISIDSWNGVDLTLTGPSQDTFLDSPFAAEPMLVRLRSADDVDGFSFNQEPSSLRLGSQEYLVVFPQVGGEQICRRGGDWYFQEDELAYRARSQTPGVCEVASLDPSEGTFSIRSLAVGLCEVVVTAPLFPRASATYSVNVRP